MGNEGDGPPAEGRGIKLGGAIVGVAFMTAFLYGIFLLLAALTRLVFPSDGC